MVGESASFAMLLCNSRANATDQLKVWDGAPEHRDLWVMDFLVISDLNLYRGSLHLLLCHSVILQLN